MSTARDEMRQQVAARNAGKGQEPPETPFMMPAGQDFAVGNMNSVGQAERPDPLPFDDETLRFNTERALLTCIAKAGFIPNPHRPERQWGRFWSEIKGIIAAAENPGFGDEEEPGFGETPEDHEDLPEADEPPPPAGRRRRKAK